MQEMKSNLGLAGAMNVLINSSSFMISWRRRYKSIILKAGILWVTILRILEEIDLIAVILQSRDKSSLL